MFRQRLLTTLILVPLVLLAIYYAPMWLLGMIIVVMTILEGWEWTNLVPIKNISLKILYIVTLVALLYLSFIWLEYWLWIGFVLWLAIIVAEVTYPNSQYYWGYPVLVGLVGIILLPLFASALAKLYLLPHGADYVVYLFCLVWAADSGAYLAGKSFGKHKLIPHVSPGKTIEGTLGGILLAVFVALVAYSYFMPAHISSWFLIAILTVIMSIFGDLFISILKRRCQLKDTGHIFPGHGGALDRLDSMIAALPLFYFALQSISIR